VGCLMMDKKVFFPLRIWLVFLASIGLLSACPHNGVSGTACTMMCPAPTVSRRKARSLSPLRRSGSRSPRDGVVGSAPAGDGADLMDRFISSAAQPHGTPLLASRSVGSDGVKCVSDLSDEELTREFMRRSCSHGLKQAASGSLSAATSVSMAGGYSSDQAAGSSEDEFPETGFAALRLPHAVKEMTPPRHQAVRRAVPESPRPHEDSRVPDPGILGRIEKRDPTLSPVVLYDGQGICVSKGLFSKSFNASFKAVDPFEHESIAASLRELSGSEKNSAFAALISIGRIIPISVVEFSLQLTIAEKVRCGEDRCSWRGAGDQAMKEEAAIFPVAFEFMAVRYELFPEDVCGKVGAREWHNMGGSLQTVKWPHVNVAWGECSDPEEKVGIIIESTRFQRDLKIFMNYLCENASSEKVKSWTYFKLGQQWGRAAAEAGVL